jgi:hypothetical protein
MTNHTLQSRFPVDYILKDLHSVVPSTCPDVSLRIFKRMQTLHVDTDPIYFPHTVQRSSSVSFLDVPLLVTSHF